MRHLRWPKRQPRRRSRATSGVGGALSWGLGWGIALACGFSALLLFACLFLGAIRLVAADAPPVLESLRVARLVPAYFLGSILSGLLFGAVRPLLRSAGRAVLIGVVAALPFFLTLRLMLLGATGWSGWDWAGLAASTLIWGSALGLFAWRAHVRVGQHRRERRG